MTKLERRKPKSEHPSGSHSPSPTAEDRLPPARAASPYDEWAVLGGVRFVLAMIVLLGHITDFSDIAHREMWTAVVNMLIPMSAVVAFLMISGYSMAHSIQKPKGFYQRRFWRIMPIYTAGLLLGLVVVWMAGGSVYMPGGQRIELPDRMTFVRNLLFLQGWNAYTVMINGPLWSLSVEVFYYALVPVFARLRPWMLLVLIALSAAKFWTLSPNLSWNLHGETMLGMAWAWLAGFYWYRYRSEWARVLLLGLSCLLVLIKFSMLSPLTVTVSWSLLASAAVMRVPQKMRATLLYLGELSYPLYALHWPAILGMYAFFQVTRPIAWAAAALCVTVVAYHVVDRPFRRGMHVRRHMPAKLVLAAAR